MRVESIGVVGTASPQAKSSSVERESKESLASAEPEKLEKKVSPEEILDKIKALSEDGQYSVRFEKDKDLGDLVIKVVDPEDGKVVRQLPPEEILGASKKMQEFRGSMVDAQV